METFNFESNIKQLLYVIVNTFYNNTDIFLRELISNSCDSIYKLKKHNSKIQIIPNEKDNILTIIDNGIGMNKRELIENIGSIGSSGTKNYIKSNTLLKTDVLRGFFGLGFYSCFLIADNVELITKNENEIFKWESKGDEKYYITKMNKMTMEQGCIIHLHLKKNMEKYLDPFYLRDIIKKHCVFCSFNIELYISNTYNIINTDKDIWNKSIYDLNHQDILILYKSITNDYKDPLHYKIFYFNNSYGILYIPDAIGKTVSKFSLYCKKIWINNNILPSFLSFLRGFVDISDLNLNVSRETYQQKNNELIVDVCNFIIGIFFKLLDDIYKNKKLREITFSYISKILKMSIYKEEKYKEQIMSYLLFNTSKRIDCKITFDEYTEKKYIFYITGESIEEVSNSPFLEIFKKLDIEVIYMIDILDEYILRNISVYKDYRFVSICSCNIEKYLDIKNEYILDEKIKLYILNILKEYIEDVIISYRLINSPCCILYCEEDWNANMERIMKAQVLIDNDYIKKKNKILEINMEHPYIKKIINNLTIKNIKMLYYIGCLVSGISIDNLKDFCNYLYE